MCLNGAVLSFKYSQVVELILTQIETTLLRDSHFIHLTNHNFQETSQ